MKRLWNKEKTFIERLNSRQIRQTEERIGELLDRSEDLSEDLSEDYVKWSRERKISKI